MHVLEDGAIRFTAPNGRTFESTLPDRTQPLGDWHQLVEAHEEQGICIDQRTAVARVDGEGYDHGFAIEALIRRARATSDRDIECRRVMLVKSAG